MSRIKIPKFCLITYKQLRKYNKVVELIKNQILKVLSFYK
jgi:hypothetical protein